jgi:hypothetical protein
MSDPVDQAIELSRSTLVMRSVERPFTWNRTPLPDDLARFFSQVEGGILLPADYSEGFSFGVEVECDVFEQSINEYYGINAGDPAFAICDLCFLLFRAPDDCELAWGVDLNPAGFGRIFQCRVTMGEHPQDTATVVARSFSEWLTFWIENHKQAGGEWRNVVRETTLGWLCPRDRD